MNTSGNTLKTALLMILAGMLITLGAQAGEGKKGHMPAFSDFDLDGNGTISQAEFDKGHAERMSKMAEQGHKMKGAAQCPGFAGIDTNEDGGISEEEFASHQAEHKKKMKQAKHQHGHEAGEK
jgi:Ca2+-binding EF-hand superfamily protein